MTDATPLKDPSLSDRVYADLKRRLMLGAVRPGQKLSMRKLAAEFGTSPMPVREALKRLASEQALESEAAKAFHVPDLSPKRAADLFELRALLEGAAARAALPRLTPARLAKLTRINDRLSAHLTTQDAPAYMADNHLFHFTIYRRADNPDMVFMIEQLWMQTGPSLRLGLERSTDTAPQWNSEHTPLLAALRAGDADAAARAMQEDIAWGAHFYRRAAGLTGP